MADKDSPRRKREKKRRRQLEKDLRRSERDVIHEGREATDLLRRALPQTVRAQARAAREEIAAQEQLGGRARQAVLDASPETAQALGLISDELSASGASEIEQLLQQQALDDLRLGGRLNAGEERQAVQGARQAYNQRGLVGSNPAAVAEVLNRTDLSRERLRDRQQFASGVDQLSTQRQQLDRAYGLDAFRTTFDAFDPAERLFGAPGLGTANLGTGLGFAGSAAAGNQEAATRGALTAFSGDLEDDHFKRNAAISQQNAAANNRSATTSAAISAGGAVLGGIAIAF